MKQHVAGFDHRHRAYQRDHTRSRRLVALAIGHGPLQLPHEGASVQDRSEGVAVGQQLHLLQPLAQVQFPAKFLRRRIIRTNEEVTQLFTRMHIDLVSIPGVHRSWKTLVKIKMKECLVKTEALLTIEDLAAEFNMSSQTLRRRLEEDGISFRALKDEVRREVILKWLAEPNIPIGEVSLRAGFAERNGLVRAVRSWVGISPREYRGRMTGETERIH